MKTLRRFAPATILTLALVLGFTTSAAADSVGLIRAVINQIFGAAVVVAAPTSGQALVYNASGQLVNGTAGGGATSSNLATVMANAPNPGHSGATDLTMDLGQKISFNGDMTVSRGGAGIALLGGTATTFPASQNFNGMEIVPDASKNATIQCTTYGTGFFSHFTGAFANGTIASPTAPVVNDVLARFRGIGYDGVSAWSIARATLDLKAAETWSGTAQGTFCILAATTKTTTSRQDRLRVDELGTTLRQDNAYAWCNATGLGSTPTIDLLLGRFASGVAYLSNATVASDPTPSSTTGLVAIKDQGSCSIKTVSYASSPSFQGFRAQNTQASPANVVADNTLAFLAGTGYGATKFGGTTQNVSAQVVCAAAENFTDAATGGYVTLATTPIGANSSAVARVRADSNGFILRSDLPLAWASGTNITSGTPTLDTKLTRGSSNIVQLTGADSVQTGHIMTAYANSTIILGSRAEGTAAVPTATSAGVAIAQYFGRGYGTSFGGGSGFSIDSAEAFTATAQGTYAYISNCTTGTTNRAPRLRVDENGAILYNTVGYRWASGSTITGASAPTADLQLYRQNAAGVLGLLQNVSGGAAALRVYATTDNTTTPSAADWLEITTVAGGAKTINTNKVGGGTAGALILATGGTAALTITTAQAIQQVGKTNTYNNVATAGWGVETVQASANATAQVGANASVATFTPAADADLDVSASLNVTVIVGATVTIAVTYTDASAVGVARTLVLPVQLAGGTAGTYLGTGSIVAVGDYATPVTHIRVKGGTACTVTTTFTGTSIVYSVSGTIRRTS